MDNNGALITQQFGLLAEIHGTPVGIDIPDFADLGAFKEFCVGLSKLRGFPSFVVGDAFNKAVSQFGEKKAMADTLIEVTGYNPKYVRTCADVLAKVPRSARRLGMSFEHHAAVSKVKGNGCEAHVGSPNPLSAPNCSDCELARLAEIANWLESAEKKKWSAKELKEQIGGRTTNVRAHQRNLDGKEFDVEAFKEAIEDVKTNLAIVKESLKITELITLTRLLHAGKGKALLGKFKDLSESMENMQEIVEKYL